MSFKTFFEEISATSISRTRTLPLESAKAVATIKEKCSTALNLYITKNCHLYKGTRNAKLTAIIDPKQFIRKSTTSRPGYNFHNIMMSILPAWRDFPKRTRSLICSNNYNVAEVYTHDPDSYGPEGSVMQVFPENNAKFGVASQSDLWNTTSFPKVSTFLDPARSTESNVVDFGITFNEILNICQGHTEIVNYRDPKPLIHTINQVANIIHNNPSILDQQKLQRHDLRRIINALKTKQNVWQFLNDLFNPAENGFKIMNLNQIANLDEFYGKEIWTDSTCVMIDVDNNQNIPIYKELGTSGPRNIRLAKYG